MTANPETQEREAGQASPSATGGAGVEGGAVSRRRLLKLAAYSVPAMSLLNVAGVARAAHMSGHVCGDAYCLTATTTPGVNAVDLSWNAIPGASRYYIQRRLAGGSTWTSLGYVNHPTTSFTAGGLTNGQEYCFRVRAWNAGGYAAWSAEVCAMPWA